MEKTKSKRRSTKTKKPAEERDIFLLPEYLYLGEDFQNVRLYPQDLAKLILVYGKEVIDDMIESLDLYIGSSGKSYANHHATILTWLKNRGLKERAAKPADLVYFDTKVAAEYGFLESVVIEAFKNEILELKTTNGNFLYDKTWSSLDGTFIDKISTFMDKESIECILECLCSTTRLDETVEPVMLCIAGNEDEKFYAFKDEKKWLFA